MPRTFSGSSALHNISPSCKVNACYRVYVYFFTSLLFAKIFLQMTHICINFPGFFNVFLEGVYTWNFIPDEIRPGWNHTCLWWNVSYCLHVFAEMRFHPGMKDRDEISSRDEKKKKRCKHCILGLNFKMSMFLISFWRMYSNMLSKVNMFEHNESMNVMKHEASF